MREVLKHELLEFHPDTLMRVRESCGLDAPGRVDEALDLLQDWIAKQEHFLKKDYPRDYLEFLLIMAKGSVEKVKKRLDLACTMRTFAPQLFTMCDARNFNELRNMCRLVVMPTLTDDHYRLFVDKLCSPYYPTYYPDIYHYIVILMEYLILHDYCQGYIFVIDPSETNAMDFLSTVNLVELRNFLIFLTKGFGNRFKGIHCVTTSKAIELFVSMVKQIVSDKIGSRIMLHRNVEELHKHVPKRYLPEDFGGEGKSTKALNDEWLPLFSSEEHIKFMKEMQRAGTDEARRRTQLDDPMFGLPGTFRALNVD